MIRVGRPDFYEPFGSPFRCWNPLTVCIGPDIPEEF